MELFRSACSTENEPTSGCVYYQPLSIPQQQERSLSRPKLHGNSLCGASRDLHIHHQCKRSQDFQRWTSHQQPRGAILSFLCSPWKARWPWRQCSNHHKKCLFSEQLEVARAASVEEKDCWVVLFVFQKIQCICNYEKLANDHYKAGRKGVLPKRFLEEGTSHLGTKIPTSSKPQNFEQATTYLRFCLFIWNTSITVGEWLG